MWFLPAASAYEKNGTVTNVCGQVQRLKRGVETVGAKTDLAIIGLIARGMGVEPGQSGRRCGVCGDRRRQVRGYNVSLPVIVTGGAAPDDAGEWARGVDGVAGADSVFARHVVSPRVL